MEKKTKYVLITEGTAYFPELLQPFERAGLYSWMKAFDGEVRMWGDIKRRKHELTEYDIIHVNSYGQDIGLAAAIAEYIKDSDTKLVVNMDIAVDYFDKDMHLRDFVKDLHAADILFAVEPTQVNLINYINFITKRKKPGHCVLMPHPVNIDVLMNEAFIPYDKRYNIVACQYHKYDAHYEIPRMLMLDLPEGYLSSMLGYIGNLNNDDMTHLVMPYQDWNRYIYFLARCKIGLEYRTHKAASRFVMESAALGIPVVTTKDSHMGQLIFPEICHDVSDYYGMRQSLERLITDEQFRLQLARLGLERLEPYNYKNSRKRMEELINEM